jgi:hypothetical protein
MTNKPKNSAACRWRSGHAGAVKENTAGAETITDNPWGYNVIRMIFIICSSICMCKLKYIGSFITVLFI